MTFHFEEQELESEGLGDLGPAVGIGRAVLVILAAWVVILGGVAWWAFS